MRWALRAAVVAAGVVVLLLLPGGAAAHFLVVGVFVALILVLDRPHPRAALESAV